MKAVKKKNKKRKGKSPNQLSNKNIEIFSLDQSTIDPISEEEKLKNKNWLNIFKRKEKISKYEKRKIKVKRNENLLLMRGIPKFWTVHILQILFIFLVEILVKLILGNLTLDYSLLRILLSSCFLSLFLSIITTNLPYKLRLSIILIFDFLVAFYAWLQIGFTHYIGMFISLGNLEQGTKITTYIWDFLCSYRLVYYTVWLPFVLAILYFVFERYITRDGFEKKFSFNILLYDFAFLVYFGLLALGFYITLDADFMQNKYQTVTNKSLFKYPSNPALAVKNFGTTVYFFLDVKGTFAGENNEATYQGGEFDNNKKEQSDLSRKIDDEAWRSLIKVEEDQSFKNLNNYFFNREITDKNEHTGIFKNKNLIMIMLESVSEAVFHPEYKEYFPTLYKLYSEGIVGVNNYSPRNNCATGESQFTSVTSLYSIETTCTINTYKNNEYRESLLYMMRNNGYYTSSYHDYDDHYYDRNVVEYKLGSYRYYDAKALNIPYGVSGAGNWPSDVEFMEKALDKFIDQKRFASYLVTVSGHMPYKSWSKTGEEYKTLFKDLNVSNSVKRYLSKVKYADLALENLLTTLEEKGILDDTVLVIFGDHYPYGLADKDFAALAPYDTSKNHEIDRTPFIIYNSETEASKITKYTSPMDYAPTILNLFGIEYDPRYYMGHDVYSDYKDFVVFADNSWQTKNGFYDASKGTFIQNETQETLSDEEIITINSQITDMRSMSNLAIKKNYFEYLFKYFEEYDKLKNQKDNETTKKEENE